MKRLLFRYMTGVILLAFTAGNAGIVFSQGASDLFATEKERNEFISEICVLIEEAWNEWQNSIEISEVDVEGGWGILMPGDMRSASISASDMLEDLDRSGHSQKYLDCAYAIAEALEEGIRSWQRGYTHKKLPFPQGASSTITLAPCENIPVKVASGTSSGSRSMRPDVLYRHMIYRASCRDPVVRDIFKSISRAISDRFQRWQHQSSITGIEASGGIAPRPLPMGPGAGPVKHAKGRGGGVKGPGLDAQVIRKKIFSYLSECPEDPGKDPQKRAP